MHCMKQASILLLGSNLKPPFTFTLRKEFTKLPRLNLNLFCVLGSPWSWDPLAY